MLGIKERSLNAALEALGLQRVGLPKQWTDEKQGFWLEAIVLVKKKNGDQSYMLARRGKDRVIKYTRDFGKMSPFMGLLGIYPYKYFDLKRFMPYEGAKELREYMISIGLASKEMLDSMTDEEVRTMAFNEGVKKQEENDPIDVAADRQASEDEAALQENNVEATIDTMDENGNFDKESEQYASLTEENKAIVEKEARKRADGFGGMDGVATAPDGTSLGFKDIVPEISALRKTEVKNVKRKTITPRKSASIYARKLK